MDIRQISIRYQPDHDRILVNINTSAGEEVQMWLTRRMTLRLWPLLNRVVIEHFAIPDGAKTDGFVNLDAMDVQSKTLLADLQRQEAIQKADFVTPYQASSNAIRPLGADPLLVTEVNLTPRGSAQMHLNFREEIEGLASHRGFQINLSPELVFAVIQLLGQALEQSQWDVGHAKPASARAMDAAQEEIDLSPDATRPTYLN